MPIHVLSSALTSAPGMPNQLTGARSTWTSLDGSLGSDEISVSNRTPPTANRQIPSNRRINPHTGSVH